MKHLNTIKNLTLIIGIITVGLFLQFNKKNNANQIKIGIIQTASHPALDAARKGFESKMQEKFGNNVKFIVKNAQGSIVNAHTIAQSFKNDSTINGILAIATPAAQAIAHIEKIKPIFITAITDPASLDLIHPTTNVCGSSDMINIDNTITLIHGLIPKAKNIAILFSVSEISATTMAKQMQEKLRSKNIQTASIGVANESDIPAAISKACKSNAILTPIDNIIASTITFIAQQAKIAKKPLIVSDNLLVKMGALAASGVDYKEAGRQAAECAINVFANKKQPASLPILKQKTGIIFINESLLHELGLKIPISLKHKIKLIKEKLS